MFSASAAVPALARQWHLSAAAAAWLTAPGTALTAQTAIGFLLTIVTIQLIPLLAAVIGWRYAFVALAAGPMTALPAMTTPNRLMRRNPRAIPIVATKGHHQNSCWPSGPPAIGAAAELSRTVSVADINLFTERRWGRPPRRRRARPPRTAT